MMCIIMLLSALMFLFVGRTGAEIRLQRISTCAQQSQWEANGQMNIAIFKINKAVYTFDGHNSLLVANADTGSPISGTTVYVTSVAGAEGWYMLEARVISGSNLYRVRTMVNEKDSMAHFSHFSLYSGVVISESTRGNIHSNQYVRFQGESMVLPGSVTTAGFLQYEGLSEGDISVQQTLQTGVESIWYPDLTYVYALGVAPYAIDTSGGYVEIKFENDSIRVKINGSHAQHYPLPSNGAILVFGDAHIKGDLMGRVTIFCSGSIKITGNLRYVDADNETAYLNGTSSQHDYVPNPDYTGESCLGLAATYNIEISSSAPNNIEVNAVTFTIIGHVGIEGYGVNPATEQIMYYDPSFNKNSVRHLGSIISAHRSAYGIYFLSTLLSGFGERKVVFDDKASAYPPPHFPALNRPYFTGWEVVR